MTIAVDTISAGKNTMKLATLRQQMRSAIASWVEFAEPEWDQFAQLFHVRWIQEGDHFLLPDATLLKEHPLFGQFQHKLTAWLLNRKEMRTRSLLLGGARERYFDFVERYPQLVGRVPQYHIASYLGITEVHMSRLRRTLAHQHST